jgi:hypothetical protein
MATYYAINAGGNWSAGSTWSTIATKDASRVGDGSQPTALDDCILDDYSGAITVDTTTCLAKTVVCTGYTALLTFTASQKLTVSGSVTFAATHTIAGTGTLAFNAAATLTMGGLTFPGSVIISGVTITLASNTTITGSVTSDTGISTLNGNTIYIGGSFTATTSLFGTTTVTLNGTGTISTLTSSELRLSTTINTAGTITIGTYLGMRNVTFTYVAGTVASGTSQIKTYENITFNTNGISFYDIYFITPGTITLTSNLTATNIIGTSVNATTGVILNGSTAYAGGISLIKSLSGTTAIILNGTGTLSCASSSVTLSNNLTIDTAGTITLGANIAYMAGTFAYTAGTVVYGTSVFTIRGSCTLATNGMSFYSMSIAASSTITLSSNLTLVGSLTSAAGTNVMNGNTCYIGGSLTATVALSGTTLLVMNGTGTMFSANSGITVSNSLTINTAGTITIGGTGLGYASGTLTYTSGTVTSIGSLVVNGSFTLNTNGMTWGAIAIRVTSTITLGSNLQVTVIKVYSAFALLTFSGAFDVTCSNLYIDGYCAGQREFTFPAGRTLTVSTVLSIKGTVADLIYSATGALVQSSVASTPFNLVYQGTPENCKVCESAFTDVAASGSAQEIKNYNGGTLTRCTNIRNVNLPVIPSSVSIGG